MSRLLLPGMINLTIPRARGIVVPSYNPLTDTPGLTSYYDVDLPSGYSTPAGVLTVKDLKGAYDLTPDNVASSPTIATSGINGKKSIQFTPQIFAWPSGIANGQAMRSLTGFPAGGSYTICGVMQSDAFSTTAFVSGNSSRAVCSQFTPNLSIIQAGVGQIIPAAGVTDGSGNTDTSLAYANKCMTGRHAQIITITYDAASTTLKLFINGDEQARNIYCGTDSDVGIWLGNQNVYNYNPLKGLIGAVAICNQALSDVERVKLEDYYAARYNIHPVVLAMAGDSLTAGQDAKSDINNGQEWYNGNGNYNYSWYKPISRFVDACYVANPSQNVMGLCYAYGGKGTDAIKTNLVNDLNAKTLGRLASKVIFVGFTGANDLSSAGSVIAPKIKSLFAQQKATGKFSDLTVCTLIPRGITASPSDTTLSQNAFDCNTILRAGDSNIDYITDFAAEAEYNTLLAFQNGTYYNSDYVHQTNASDLRMAAYIRQYAVANGKLT